MLSVNRSMKRSNSAGYGTLARWLSDWPTTCMRGPRTSPRLIALRRSTVPNPPRESMSSTVVKPAFRSVCAFATPTMVRVDSDRLSAGNRWTCASIMPGKHRRRAQVDDRGVRRDCHRWTDVSDAVAPDEDDLIRQHRARPAVEQATRANRHDLRRRRHEPGRCASLGTQEDGRDDDCDERADHRPADWLLAFHAVLRSPVGADYRRRVRQEPLLDTLSLDRGTECGYPMVCIRHPGTGNRDSEGGITCAFGLVDFAFQW